MNYAGEKKISVDSATIFKHETSTHVVHGWRFVDEVNGSLGELVHVFLAGWPNHIYFELRGKTKSIFRCCPNTTPYIGHTWLAASLVW